MKKDSPVFAGRVPMVFLNLLVSTFYLVAFLDVGFAGVNLDRAAPRGRGTKSFSPGEGKSDEVCVLPKHLSGGDYSDKAEEMLCSLDFYKVQGSSGDDGVVALCPKNTSTSAATDLYEVDSEHSKASLETVENCGQRKRATKLIAKFKQTDNEATCTNTASVLGYYHVSAALGGIAEVPPAVLRTMDSEEHSKRVVSLSQKIKLPSLLSKSWGLFKKYYADPKQAPHLFTTDQRQIYGAIVKNVNGESEFKDWTQVGESIEKISAFQWMAKERPIKEVIKVSFEADPIQRLVSVRDMSEMILLDTLMWQSDRLSGGNMSSKVQAYILDGKKVKKLKKGEEGAGAARVEVRRLVLKDTDCGFLNGNTFAKKGYLDRVSHMHPETYKRLLELARAWKADASLREFFKAELTFTEKEVSRFEQTLLDSAAKLQARCEAKKLFLDLDLDDLIGGDSAGRVNCSGQLVADQKQKVPSENERRVAGE